MTIPNIEDLNKFSLSEQAHEKLKQLQQEGHFLEMRDAYRMGIALALSKGIRPPEIKPPKASGIYSISQIDPDQTIALAIKILMGTDEQPPYRWAERLAEWGIEELSKESRNGQINFAKLLSEINNIN